MSRLLNSRLGRLVIVVAVLTLFVLMIILAPVSMPTIELAAEPVIPPLPAKSIDILGLKLPEEIFGFKLFLSNSLIASWLSMIVLIVFSFLATRNMKMVPSGLQNVAELIVETTYNFFGSIAGDRIAKFFPWVMTIFLWVLVSNWMGLVPGFASIGYLHEVHGDKTGYKAETVVQAGPIHLRNITPEKVEPAAEDAHETDTQGSEETGYVLVPFLRSVSSDLSFTLTLAVISVFMTQVFGLQTLGLEYVNRFIPFRSFGALLDGKFMSGIDLIVGPLELVSEMAKIISFSFRLFGNVFAGEVLLGVLIFLIPQVVPLPFYGLELFVGAMQAFVFGILTLMFMTIATTSHSGDGH